MDEETEPSPGTRVTDVRVDTCETATVARLQMLLATTGVLVFPDQHDVDDAAFLRFLRSFGDLAFTEGETPVPTEPELNVISNVGRSSPPRSSFHVDTSYVRHPPAYTALRAVQVPSDGGATLFTDQYAAYESLPESVRAELDGRTVLHSVTGLELDDDAEKSASHPIFRVHPFSGRTSLYLSTPQRCSAITGMGESESEQMIDYLYDHSTRPANITAQRWKSGDVVMWDNRCVMHRGDHSGVVGDRVFHRGMVR